MWGFECTMKPFDCVVVSKVNFTDYSVVLCDWFSLQLTAASRTPAFLFQPLLITRNPPRI